jgi:hypothetical protein
MWHVGLKRKDVEIQFSTIFADWLGRPHSNKGVLSLTISKLNEEKKACVTGEAIIIPSARIDTLEGWDHCRTHAWISTFGH